MHVVLRRYTTAALAAAGAGLVAVSLAASAAADPTDVVQQVAATGESEVTEGLALFSQGDLTDGLSYVVDGENNVLVAVPEDALLAGIESPDQPFDWTYFTAIPQPPFAESFDQLSANLQFLYDTGESYLSQGVSDIAQGAMNLGEDQLIVGSNALTVDLAEQLVFSPLSIAFANVG